ncbi:MAG TPA: hypothetical protein VGP72_30355 [Planctomycetota bacterium]|jgi:hypothetical protein
MVRVSIAEAKQHSFGEMAEQVSTSHEEIVVTGPDGDMVKLVPVPKPVEHYKGRPVYNIDDAQHLDFPFWSEEPRK